MTTARDLLDACARALASAVDEGGFVAPPLLGIALVLAYALAERAFLLRRGTRRSLSALIETMRTATLGPVPSVLSVAVTQMAEAHARTVCAPHARRASALRVSLAGLDDMLTRHAALIRTLVVIAPLLGLLGTVSGMIETFDSLASMTMHASGNGGVAGGISEALVSTELGLLVAIPGLLIGRLLDRAERMRKDELMALVDLAVALPLEDSVSSTTGGA